MKERYKSLLRPIKRLLFSIAYGCYDTWRFVRYSSLTSYNGKHRLDYEVIKSYHSLEKSLSFRHRRAKSGWRAAIALAKVLEKRSLYSAQEKTAVKVLELFTNQSEADITQRDIVEKYLASIDCSACKEVDGGYLDLNKDFLSKGVLDDPEIFFNSRYSIRSFRRQRVDIQEVKRALSMAEKTPSVCNRQSWRVYHIDDAELVKDALKLQNGNSGFASEISNLIVIATDLRAFDTEIERFQYWIDGGLYAMSLVYAFHSIGIASCFLNLSLTPGNDCKLRRLLKARNEYSFITMIAIGYPEEETRVCVSSRSNYESYCTFL